MDVNGRIGLLKGLNDLGEPVRSDTEIRADINIARRQTAKLGTVLKYRLFIANELPQER